MTRFRSNLQSIIHATPYIWQNEKRTELITCGTKRVRSGQQ